MADVVRLSRRQQQVYNRSILLNAAERIFARRGIQATSLDAVALEAGLTKGAVYSNFQSKGDLVLAVLTNRRTASEEGVAFRELLADPNLTAQERLEAWIQHWIDTFRRGEHESYARLMLEFIPYALRDAHLRERLKEFLGQPPQDSPQNSPIPPGTPLGQLPVVDQSRILMALDLGIVIQALISPDEVSPDLYRTALYLLTGRPSPRP